MKLFRASAEDVVSALLLPKPRGGAHDALPAVEVEGDRTVLDATVPVTLDVAPAPGPPPRPRAVPAPERMRAVERELAHLAGVPAMLTADADDAEPVPVVDVRAGDVDYAARLLRVAQLVAVGGLVAIASAAVLSGVLGTGSLDVHPVALGAWGVAAALSGVALASRGADMTSRTRRGPSVLGAVLLVVMLVSMSGVVASAGGAAGPAWVLFLPVVLVCGAVLGPTLGLVVGAAAGAGVYTAAGLTHTLTVVGSGRLVVILPVCPAAGWAAGALARLARSAAEEAAAGRAALERDVDRLSQVLAAVADGDLTRVPAPGEAADPVAVSLAVVFADTLLALRRLVRQMNVVTEQLTTSAGQMSDTAGSHVAAVEAQTAAVAETTTTVEQLAATAGAIAEVAVRVSQFAGSTRRDVDAGASAVEASNDAMNRIATRVADLATSTESLRERIARVGATTRLIDDISRRTTILAVNASIEAARVGDHGHGFSTVAAEVNVLAERARAATAQITQILGDLEQQAQDTALASQEGLEAVVEGAERQADVVESLRRITTMVDRTTAAAREITEATRQQRFASDAVVAAMTTVTESGDRYRSGSQGHAVAAKRMHGLAAALKTSLERFRVA